jgi:outer membrane lipoprotein-sorting protein
MNSIKSAPFFAPSVRAHWALIIILISVLSIPIFSAQEKKDPDLQRIYRQMDERAKTFRSFKAKITQKKYTAVLKEFETPDETGEFYYKRAKDGTPLLRLEFTSPGKKILTIKKGFLTFYQPAINQARETDLGKDQDKAEYLAVGLNQSPSKLENDFDISYKGEEAVNGSSCDILLFKPKRPNIAKYFSFMTVWYKKSNGIPIQNKKVEPNGDYVLIIFSEEKRDVDIPDSKFEQKLSSKVEKQKF